MHPKLLELLSGKVCFKFYLLITLFRYIFQQVRILLVRAHAVSKIWNDAPIVLCGDYNCVPKVSTFTHLSFFLACNVVTVYSLFLSNATFM